MLYLELSGSGLLVSNLFINEHKIFINNWNQLRVLVAVFCLSVSSNLLICFGWNVNHGPQGNPNSDNPNSFKLIYPAHSLLLPLF